MEEMVDAQIGGPDIVWLGEPACHDILAVGGKAAHLSRLAALHRIPPGFCLTAAFYERASSQSVLPSDLYAAVIEAYTTLALTCGHPEPRVAVRSSAIDEDGPLASFAGQHETYLNIVGIDALVDAVERCWASGRSEQVLAYRRQHGLSEEGIRLAVLVQQLVLADVSAIMFSANPVTGQHQEAVITASWGLGESIVGGTVTPDSWLVRTDTLDIIEQRIGDKRRMTVAVPGGTREVDVPRLLRNQPGLSHEQVREMTQLGRQLEEAMGWPVDAECAYAGGRLYLLQCRPITTLNRPALSGSSSDSVLLRRHS